MDTLEEKVEHLHEHKLMQLIQTKQNPYTEEEVREMSVDRARKLLMTISLFRSIL